MRRVVTALQLMMRLRKVVVPAYRARCFGPTQRCFGPKQGPYSSPLSCTTGSLPLSLPPSLPRSLLPPPPPPVCVRAPLPEDFGGERAAAEEDTEEKCRATAAHAELGESSSSPSTATKYVRVATQPGIDYSQKSVT
jgi:hypothetical protein